MPGPILRQLFLALFCLLFASGCGAAIQRNGTDQLLLSDSVDRAIDQLDLSPLAGRTVYLDTTYMQTFKGANVFINSDYIISALRQKLTTTGCLIQVTRLEADYVIEGRVGALGTDSMEVTYGIPSSNGLGTAASALGGVPAVPVIPEISVGKRNGVKGISKIVVFAYHRETSIPVWQSGSAVARSDARDSWFLGIGPLTRGSVYNGTMLAGNRINLPFEKKIKTQGVQPLTMADKHSYVHPAVLEQQLTDAQAIVTPNIEQASHQTGGMPTTTSPVKPTPVIPTPATPTPATPTPVTPTPATPTPATPTPVTPTPVTPTPVTPTPVTPTPVTPTPVTPTPVTASSAAPTRVLKP